MIPIIVLFSILIITVFIVVFSKHNKIICKNGKLTPDGKCLCDEKLVNCSANANYSEVAIDFLEMHLESLEGRQFKEGFI